MNKNRPLQNWEDVVKLKEEITNKHNFRKKEKKENLNKIEQNWTTSVFIFLQQIFCCFLPSSRNGERHTKTILQWRHTISIQTTLNTDVYEWIRTDVTVNTFVVTWLCLNRHHPSGTISKWHFVGDTSFVTFSFVISCLRNKKKLSVIIPR